MEYFTRFSQHIVQRARRLLRLCSKKKSSSSNQLQQSQINGDEAFRCKSTSIYELSKIEKYSPWVDKNGERTLNQTQLDLNLNSYMIQEYITSNWDMSRKICKALEHGQAINRIPTFHKFKNLGFLALSGIKIPNN